MTESAELGQRSRIGIVRRSRRGLQEAMYLIYACRGTSVRRPFQRKRQSRAACIGRDATHLGNCMRVKNGKRGTAGMVKDTYH